MTFWEIFERPEFIDTIAGWIHREWGGESPYHSLENEVGRMRQQKGPAQVPFTLIATREDIPLGTATVLMHQHSMVATPSFWLSYVLVPPENRGGGIGRAIVAATAEAAEARGVEKLSLLTTTRRDFFSLQGWSTIQETHYGGTAVVMEKLLRPAADGKSH